LEVRINIGARIRTERKAKNFSQADLERRCGLARCRISWLEHGRAVPTIQTLARIADALEIPAYRLLQDLEDGSQALVIPHKKGPGERQEASGQSGVRLLGELRMHLERMSQEDKLLLIFIAEKMAGRFPMARGDERREAWRKGAKQVRN
jgi:transcriptional regulator with XRE-family HTH domain